ncbi:MAG: ATP-dependent DNA helicase UvrD2 [Micromonosporaceae bacterium]
MPDTLLAGLDPEQRAVAETVRGPVCVLAGAGTGKTRAITYRIAHAVHTGAVDPRHVLAVTFTTRAAGELRGRLRKLGGPGSGMDRVQARTFHAAALRQLVYFWPRVVGGEPPRVVDSKLGLVAEAARALRIKLDRAALRDAASEIEWAKAVQARPEDYAASAANAGRVPPVPADQMAKLFERYERLRRDSHVLDFESMLELTAGILAEHVTAAAQVHDQYRYFVVDEYQDVNPLQKLLLDTWLGGRDDVCVVGDPNQTIYSFTGATPAFLTGFTAEFPSAAVIRLTRDYRSTPQVVRLANRLIAAERPGPVRGKAAAGQPGPLPAHSGAPIPAKGAGLAPGTPAAHVRYGAALVGQRPDGPHPAFAEYPDEEAEAGAVAAQARALIEDGLAARQVAVLVRTNAQTEVFERALRDAGVAYAVRGAERFFDRPEVRQALVMLRAAAKSEPAGGSGDASPGRSTAAADAVGHVLAGLGLTPEAPPAGGAMRERWESLAALAQLAEDQFAAHPDATLADFAAELADRASLQHAPALDGVTIASLHAAKGLEWDAVFLPALVDGVMPIIYASTPEAVEEERRLLYVGVTRARERLLLSWSLARSPGGRRSRRPSPFLEPLYQLNGSRGRSRPGYADDRGRGKGRKRAASRAPRCSVCGRALGGAAERKLGRCETCPAHCDEALLGRLKEWRLAAAREHKVPEYVVFTDVTLQVIAERQPRSEAELVTVPGVGRAKLDRYGADVLRLCMANATDG